jgi:tetratricopeptide (TPR) repeat protein
MLTTVSQVAGTNSAEMAWDALTEAFLSHSRATPERLQAFLTAAPDMAIGPFIKGYMLLLLGRGELVESARQAHAEGTVLLAAAPDPCAALYGEGLDGWLRGEPRRAVSALERVIADHPMDAMAVKLSHAIRFILGDADGMRRSLARVVSIYTETTPFAGYIRGCYAFALEETGAYDEAMRVGLKAVALAPDDAWGRHAVAHVHEMRGETEQGLAWLSDPALWSHCNNFRFHMAWHKALFHLEAGEPAEALSLYDMAVRCEKTDDYRDIANAASLLQRLELDGCHVDDRWEELADIAERRIGDRRLVFADLHYLLALAGAGRSEGADRLARSLLAETAAGHDAELAREVGAPAAAAILAFAGGDMASAAALLGQVMPRLRAIGGSHAQRDVFSQIHIEALTRIGGGEAVTALALRKHGRMGRNRFASLRLERLLGSKPLGELALEALRVSPARRFH